MIDTSHPGAWAEATQPDHRDLKYLPSSELQRPFIHERVCRWHGVSMGEARDMVGAELRRRTTTTGWEE